MLKAMSPVDEQVTQENDFDNLKPEWLDSNGLTKLIRDEAGQPTSSPLDCSENETSPEKVLAKEKKQIGPEGRPDKSLTFFRGKEQLERSKE